jgi:hypothetical protein
MLRPKPGLLFMLSSFGSRSLQNVISLAHSVYNT